MSRRPYKFMVQAVVQEVGADGEVTGELRSEPLEIFGCEQLAEWARDFPAALAASEETAEGEGRRRDGTRLAEAGARHERAP